MQENKNQVYCKKENTVQLGEHLRTVFGISEPIFLEDIEFDGYSRERISEELHKLINKGELKLYDEGIYYFSEKTPWGTESKPNFEKIISRKFISNNEAIYGYISGLPLWNGSGLMTQVPPFIEVTSNYGPPTRQKVYIGGKSVFACKGRTVITKDNVFELRFLELMNIVDISKLDEYERTALSKFIQDYPVKRDIVMKYVALFPSKVEQSMKESEIIYELA